MTEAPCWLAWFDGAALPNPGKIGLGAVLVSPDGERLERAELPGCCGCNNEAELLALCAVLKLAHGAGARRVVVRGDSDFVVRHLQGCATTQIDRLLPLLASSRELLQEFEHVELLWIPRHRNRDADRLSRQALGLPEKPATLPGRKRRR